MTTGQEHAARLRRLMEYAQHGDDRVVLAPAEYESITAGAAALDEVATLRAERDAAHNEIAALEQRLRYLESHSLLTLSIENTALRARVQQLTEALRTIEWVHHCCPACRHNRYAYPHGHAKDCWLNAALTPPAPTEGQ